MINIQLHVLEVADIFLIKKQWLLIETYIDTVIYDIIIFENSDNNIPSSIIMTNYRIKL